MFIMDKSKTRWLERLCASLARYARGLAHSATTVRKPPSARRTKKPNSPEVAARCWAAKYALELKSPDDPKTHGLVQYKMSGV